MPDGKSRRGVVVGKFYPPHLGHRHLIETALTNVDQLTAIVCGRPGERPEPELRSGWLKEMFPNVDVKLVEDVYDPDDSRLWAQLTVDWLGFKPDVAFTSEEYGPRWAGFMGCEHVSIDPRRCQFSVSGTAIRTDPFGHWQFLEPCARAYYTRRVVVIGAESTGTTTMAKSLADHYHTVWVAEYGREYSEEMFNRLGAYEWSSDDFVRIASEQGRREDAAAREANRVLICDTDAFATTIWHERYMQSESDQVKAIAAKCSCDLYLVTDLDVPFVQDGYRDGVQIRAWMHERFVSELERTGRPYLILSGPHKKRLREAVAAVDSLIGTTDHRRRYDSQDDSHARG